MATWDTLQQNRRQRLRRAADCMGSDAQHKAMPAARVEDLPHAVLQPGDRVCIEGNNQKQADFLARARARLDPQGVAGSGNLDVLLQPAPASGACDIAVTIAAIGFAAIRETVPRDFPARWRLTGLRVGSNDVGATPAVPEGQAA